ncbi:MAG: amino acid ABC transporter permease [Desulfobacterales bacterium]|nr:MAG: amino acid ABC transporter permease [Desulfobacterales bacterium]
MWGFYFKQLIDTVPFFLKGLWITVTVSFPSFMCGTAIGLAWGIIRAGRGKCLRQLIGMWVNLIRGTPFLVQIFIVFFILPEAGIELEAFPAAVLSLTNLAACFICEIVAGGILAVPAGQSEAATASGLSAYQQLRYVILPQALRTILPPLVGQYVLLIKDSSVVSVIGVVDVTRVGWLTVPRIPEGLMVFGLVGILYAVICYPLIRLSNSLEKRLTIETTRL